MRPLRPVSSNTVQVYTSPPSRPILTLIILSLTTTSHAYMDFFTPYNPPRVIYTPFSTASYIPSIPTPIPHQVRDFAYIHHQRSASYIQRLPSMITAIAPSITVAPNGTFDFVYSMHYHDFFVRTGLGKGVFKRGVFASDPPISTCTPCGGMTANSAETNTTTTGPVASCTTHAYAGVFRSNVGLAASSATSYCYDSNYSGVLQSSATSSTGLPCCFTIPASCLANSSTTMTYSSGVFRSTNISSSFIFATNSTGSTSQPRMTTTASPSSSSVSSMVRSTSSSSTFTSDSVKSPTTALTSPMKPVTSSSKAMSSGISIAASASSIRSSSSNHVLPASSSASSSGMGTFSTYSSPSSFDQDSSSRFISSSAADSSILHPSSPAPPSTSSAAGSVAAYSASSSAETTSITVISSITVLVQASAPHSLAGGQGQRPANPISQVIISVVTAKPSSSFRVPVMITLPNSVEGCGTASGSGIIIGTGTVYFGAGYIPVVSSGTVSGYASKVVGCGTIMATTGSFRGSGTIIGCGTGSGTATMTGSGTVWPAALGGVVSFVSSGTVTGSGRVEGCGSMTGSGTFSATNGLVITSKTPPQMTIVEVFVSYCPNSTDMGLPKLASNQNDQASVRLGNSSSLVVSTSATSVINTLAIYQGMEATLENPLCKICPNDVGTCCPPHVACNVVDGHCPWRALQGAGYSRFGWNVVAQMNSTGPMRLYMHLH